MCLSHGKPIARVIPIAEPATSRDRWKGAVELVRDLVNFDSSKDWEALK